MNSSLIICALGVFVLYCIFFNFGGGGGGGVVNGFCLAGKVATLILV